MNRRDAVKAAGVMLGGAMLLGGLPGCGPSDRNADTDRGNRLLTPADEALLLAFADTLLPDTDASPGARQAGCGPAMNLLVTDCFDAAAQQRVTAAIAAFRTRAPNFASTPSSDRDTLLRTIDTEAVSAGGTHWFHLLRDLSLRTYFSSEVGITQAMRYVREPGQYIGITRMRPGQPAWS